MQSRFHKKSYSWALFVKKKSLYSLSEFLLPFDNLVYF